MLLGATPHLALLAHVTWPRTVEFGWTAGGELAEIPFALYSASELYIVPATLVVVVAAAAVRRARPWALWLLLGTLAGATAMLMVLATAATTWRG